MFVDVWVSRAYRARFVKGPANNGVVPALLPSKAPGADIAGFAASVLPQKGISASMVAHWVMNHQMICIHRASVIKMAETEVLSLAALRLVSIA